jgi:hypothetical protein
LAYPDGADRQGLCRATWREADIAELKVVSVGEDVLPAQIGAIDQFINAGVRRDRDDPNNSTSRAVLDRAAALR